jgi:hypothetical protein
VLHDTPFDDFFHENTLVGQHKANTGRLRLFNWEALQRTLMKSLIFFPIQEAKVTGATSQHHPSPYHLCWYVLLLLLVFLWVACTAVAIVLLLLLLVTWHSPELLLCHRFNQQQHQI